MEKELNFNLADFLNYLKQKALKILSLALGITVLVISLSFFLDDYYISSARLTVVEDQSAPSGNPVGFLGSIGGGLGIGGSALNSKILEVEEIMTSRDFFRELLTSNPEIFNNILYADSYNKDTKNIRYLKGAPAIEDIIEKNTPFPINKNFF